MSGSGSVLLDPGLIKGWSCLSKGKADLPVLVQSGAFLQRADPSFMNSVTGSVCRAKCSNVLQDFTHILRP